MAFNITAATCDDHTKNRAFVLMHAGEWTLAPAFDVTYAHHTTSEGTYRHVISVNGQFLDINREVLLAIANRAGVRGTRRLLANVKNAVEA